MPVKQLPSLTKPIPAARARRRDVLVPVEDHLRAERRVPGHLDHHMAPGRVHDVEAVVIDVRPLLRQVAVAPRTERLTSHTLAGAFAARTRNTPVPTSWLPGTPRRSGAYAPRPCSRSAGPQRRSPRPSPAGQTGPPSASGACCPAAHRSHRAAGATSTGTRPGCAPRRSRRSARSGPRSHSCRSADPRTAWRNHQPCTERARLTAARQPDCPKGHSFRAESRTERSDPLSLGV